MKLDEFNLLSDGDATLKFFECCHCKDWAERMTNLRPFISLESLYDTAIQEWKKADEQQILEAFSGHARIGDIELLRSKYAGRASQEQGQVLQASEATIQEIYALNQDYEARYGFIFIVCATGKSADDMLELLKARIHNGREIELINGASAQCEITQIRLRKMFS